MSRNAGLRPGGECRAGGDRGRSHGCGPGLLQDPSLGIARALNPAQGLLFQDPVSPAPELLQPAWSHPPARLWLGTASWAYPGWKGLVYDQNSGALQLSRHGLGPYSKHPLLRAVALDRTFYAPLGAQELTRLANLTPPDFRFLVKAPQQLTRRDSAHYLDFRWARQWLLEPVQQGLGSRLGSVHFYFPPGPRDSDFASRLGRFLTRLDGPVATELRHPELLSPDYVAALRDAGASHALNILPGMPREQPCVGALRIVRWTLRPCPPQRRWNLREAALRYLPFDRLRDPDPDTRDWLAQLVSGWLQAGHSVLLIANNKAEGCAPLSLLELTRKLG